MNMNHRDYEVEVFYDGQCPLCLREIRMLRWMDRKQRILFTDISREGFSPEAYGKDMDELMGEIHARLPDHTWITGVEVFRRLYSAVGFKTLASLTRLPIVSGLLDFGYNVFAKNRLRLTGRCSASGECKTQPRSQRDSTQG